LWFDSAQEVATLSITDPNSEIARPRLHCGIAGVSGPVVWQASEFPDGRRKHWQLDRSALIRTTGECDQPISTIAGLRRAAEDRILYVEYEINGVPHRGQLWARALMADQSRTVSALATKAQVVDPNERANVNKIVARMRLSDQGGLKVHYFLDAANAPEPLSAATLHCGPPGAVGPIVAELRLTPNATWNLLAPRRLSSVASDDACGLEINNTASLVEAYLRGLLYFRIEGGGGEIWRGQVQVP
jgi:hypothetical protein